MQDIRKRGSRDDICSKLLSNTTLKPEMTCCMRKKIKCPRIGDQPGSTNIYYEVLFLLFIRETKIKMKFFVCIPSLIAYSISLLQVCLNLQEKQLESISTQREKGTGSFLACELQIECPRTLWQVCFFVFLFFSKTKLRWFKRSYL